MKRWKIEGRLAMEKENRVKDGEDRRERRYEMNV